jgi:hypothetical protein
VKPWHVICADRRVHVHVLSSGGDGGAFYVKSPTGKRGDLLQVIATDGLGWDHVSVSMEQRLPTWPELEHVKRIFFAEDEVAMQLHVPAADHINVHPNCLHLWRPQAVPIPLPDKIMV